jgi:hypothetical protein
LPEPINHSDVLGSEETPSHILFILFIPSKDKNGNALSDQEQWANAGATLLSELFGGATEMPPAKGKWFNPETKQVISEEIILVHSYATDKDANDAMKVGRLARFLHRMGRETNQGEVAIVIGDVFHRITKFNQG